jgi:hypothetical protein
MNKHFYHDIAPDQMLQLLETASILEMSPHYECEHTTMMIHRIIVKALSFRCLHHHGWAMPEPLPDRVPKAVVLRSGRTVTVINSQIKPNGNYNFLSCTENLLFFSDGCNNAETGSDGAFSTCLLLEVVNAIETDKYWYPIGDEPLEVAWSLKSDAPWPKIMSFRLDDAMSYVYDDD